MGFGVWANALRSRVATRALVQSAPPVDSALLPNWLPTPAAAAAKFNLIGRAYWPGPELLNNSWAWPAVVGSTKV